MTIDELARRLGSCLRQEIDAASGLLDLLRQENAVLTDGDPAAIEEVGRSKQDALDSLEALGRQRTEMVAAAGPGIDPQDIEGLIRRCDPAGRTNLPELWEQLLELAAECQRLNMVNGAIIQSSSRFAQQALGLLRGQSPAAGLEYGPDGSTHQPLGSSSLAKA